MTDEPPPIPLTTAEEGVQIWAAKFAIADAKARPAFLDFGHALLALRREVGGNDTAFNKKLVGLNLKINDKNIRADAQKLAFQVEAGLRTREDALALPAREVRALPGLTHGEHGLALKPKVKRAATPKKPKPAGDEASEALGIKDRSDGEDASASIMEASTDGAGIADKNGGAKQVGGSADGSVATTTIIIHRTSLANLLAIAQEAVGPRTWRKYKTWGAIIADAEHDITSDRDSSGRSARQKALAEIGQALEALLTS